MYLEFIGLTIFVIVRVIKMKPLMYQQICYLLKIITVAALQGTKARCNKTFCSGEDIDFDFFSDILDPGHFVGGSSWLPVHRVQWQNRTVL